MAKVLIIDDEGSIRETLAMFFHERGYSVLASSNGHGGLALCREKVPDAIILDVQLPDMNGIKVLEMIKILDPHIPVFMITAHKNKETTHQALKSGACFIFSKPFDAEELERTIASVLEAKDGEGKTTEDPVRHCNPRGI